MNILFLDVDGVLNNTRSVFEDGEDFNPFNTKNLKVLCESLKPRIVISSDWRRSPKTLARVRSELMALSLSIFDTTQISKKMDRKDEIAEFLNEEVWDKAIILDDMDAEFCDPKMDAVLFHQTDAQLGLTEEDVDRILNWSRTC